MEQLAGKVAIVSGGTKGIGYAISTTLARARRGSGSGRDGPRRGGGHGGGDRKKRRQRGGGCGKPHLRRKAANKSWPRRSLPSAMWTFWSTTPDGGAKAPSWRRIWPLLTAPLN